MSFAQMRCHEVMIDAGIGELAHFDIGAAVAQKLDSLRAGAGMARAIHDQVGAKAADDVAHFFDPLIGRLELLDIHRRLGAELARERKPRRLRRADADHPARAHFLRGRHRQNPDRAGALDDDGVAPCESAGADRAIEGADARGQRLGQGAEPQRHVVGQFVDLRARQHVEIDIDIFRPAAPQMRRLVEAEIAAVVDRREALVGVLRIVDAVIAMPARHQRRDHHLRSHLERPAHEILFELAADLDEDAAELVSERERPRQRLRPVTLEDMQVGAANAAGADLDERRLLADVRPRHGADHRLRAGTGEGGNANLFHRFLAPVHAEDDGAFLVTPPRPGASARERAARRRPPERAARSRGARSIPAA